MLFLFHRPEETITDGYEFLVTHQDEARTPYLLNQRVHLAHGPCLLTPLEVGADRSPSKSGIAARLKHPGAFPRQAKLFPMTLSRPKVWTYEDVQRLPEDGNRYEVIDGVLYVSPSPRQIHQLLSRRLQHFFYQFELENAGYVYNSPMDLLIQGGTPLQPDLMFLLPEQFSQIQEKWIQGPPHLVVEILSPSTASRDRVKKLRKYASNGIPYYLLVDPDSQTLEVLQLSGASYLVAQSLEVGDRWEFRGKVLELATLFAPLHDPNAVPQQALPTS